MPDLGTIWKEHPIMVLSGLVGIAAFIIVLFSISIGPLSKVSINGLIVSACIAIGGILLTAFSIMLLAFDIGFRKTYPEAFDVRIIEHPDDIWENSVRILNGLREGKYYDRHAFDVTSFLNKIRYEEAVVNVLDTGVTFDRAFCFNEKSTEISERAMNWFYRKIIDGGEIEENEIDEIELELRKAFKEKITDDIPKKLDKWHMERLQKMINGLHRHFKSNLLRLKNVPHHVNVDFVLSEYIPKRGERPAHEVMANFKTSIRGETYIMGTIARGTLARGYKEMFTGVIMR